MGVEQFTVDCQSSVTHALRYDKNFSIYSYDSRFSISF